MIKYYAPIKDTYSFLAKLIKPNSKVLELGPGHVSFPNATHFCGWDDEESKKLPNYKVVNFSEDTFPYEDKEFDFVYARHVLEDLRNPIHCIKEMSRIAKAGYVETPSPLIEMSRNADNYDNSEEGRKWRGYQHHYSFVWNNGVLNFLHKYTIVEFIDINEDVLIKQLEQPIFWNTYYLWKDKIEYMLHEHPKDFLKPSNQSYPDLIVKAISEAGNNAETFYKLLEKNK